MRTYEPMIGEDIRQSCEATISLAQANSEPVTFTHNGVTVTANPDSTAEGLYQQWRAEMDRQAEEYRRSPEGIRQAEEAKARLVSDQGIVDSLIDRLPDVLHSRNLDNLMSWCKNFTNPADHTGVTFEHQYVFNLLMGAGYIENAHVGKAPEFFDNRQVMGEWIVGQVIDCLSKGMGPHPITQMFVDKYFELPAKDGGSN